MGQLQFLKEARHSLIDDGDTVATGCLRQCAPQPCFADATRASDDQITFVGDPSAGEQALEQCLIEATARAVIDIFGAGANMAQPGCPHAGLKPLCVSACNLAINK